jgi:hypothetical protein
MANPLAPVAGPVGALLSFVAIWMGAAPAHNAKGWRSLVLPILGFFFVVAAPMLVYSMLGGALFSLESLLTRLGFMPYARGGSTARRRGVSGAPPPTPRYSVVLPTQHATHSPHQ